MCFATLSLAPTLGLAFFESLHAAHAETAAITTNFCARESEAGALADFAFYSDGTLTDGSPAIECNHVQLADQKPGKDGSETLKYSMRCYTLDRSTQRDYWVTADHFSTGECRVSWVQSRDASP